MYFQAFKQVKKHFYRIATCNYSVKVLFFFCLDSEKGVYALNSINLAKVYDVILKHGIQRYKEKNSKAALPVLVKADREESGTKKGAIFVVRSKADFTERGVKGYIVTSKETLLEDAKYLTHWTPNVYRKFGYADEKRKYVIGHEENHLLQVNTFVIDIDTKQHSVQDILLACLDESVGAPTIILESDRGYQVYFVLDKPIFISNKRNFISLTVAKRISNNLKKSLAAVDADIYCNDFGFFRMPNANNIVWFNENALYSASELISYSQRKDDDAGRQLFVVPSKLTVTNVIHSEWFSALVNTTDVKGQKGQLGRNNLLFTLALVCLSSGKSEEYAFDLIDQVNANFKYPLKGSALYTIAASAYSGKYKGAKKEYIEHLLQLYVVGDFEVNFGGGWYKHKKARADRQRSHANEWEQDIINFIEKRTEVESFVKISQKELCLAIGIPSSTLNKVLKASTKILKRVIGGGRSSKTLLTTVAAFIKHALKNIREVKANYSEYLKVIVEAHKFEDTPAASKLETYIEQLVPSPVETESDNVIYLFGDSS